MTTVEVETHGGVEIVDSLFAVAQYFAVLVDVLVEKVNQAVAMQRYDAHHRGAGGLETEHGCFAFGDRTLFGEIGGLRHTVAESIVAVWVEVAGTLYLVEHLHCGLFGRQLPGAGCEAGH